MDPAGPRTVVPDGGMKFLDRGYDSSDSGLDDLM